MSTSSTRRASWAKTTCAPSSAKPRNCWPASYRADPTARRVRFGGVSLKLTTEDREKRSAALSSLVAALGMTSMKTIVGLLTGSLGILAEAAHSALDLVAALMTYIAVRISGKPPDRTHLYGHGKVENLSALLETLLLFVTCGWIIREALHRLFSHKVEVEVTVWSFVVMVTSIVIDYSRSRLLARTAKKYNSQALEADALHFKTDVWSSSVVIVGLACVKLGEWAPSLGWLRESDAVAALGVSALVICCLLYTSPS